ncbi:unnamed protein product, partial [Nippostrongylus brasiliensis]|uniref:Reverse transcriptase domain-containing protein n=1 Tax=Nippostrongylus brasiliensis TaxID=27835 RepID=A0A158R1I2_NIPBR
VSLPVSHFRFSKVGSIERTSLFRATVFSAATGYLTFRAGRHIVNDPEKPITLLSHFGFHPILVKWLGVVLKDRTFQVKVGSLCLTVRSASSGVPKGGVLSPISFALYTADLPAMLEDCGVVRKKFADDLKFYRKVDSAEDKSKVQAAWDRIFEWFGTRNYYWSTALHIPTEELPVQCVYYPNDSRPTEIAYGCAEGDFCCGYDCCQEGTFFTSLLYVYLLHECPFSTSTLQIVPHFSGLLVSILVFSVFAVICIEALRWILNCVYMCKYGHPRDVEPLSI